MRKPVTDIALLAYIAKNKSDALSYTEATKACKSSSSASRALHQLIDEGLIEPKPKLVGLRYVTQYVITPRGKQVSQLALQLSELRASAVKMKMQEAEQEVGTLEDSSQSVEEIQLPLETKAAGSILTSNKKKRAVLRKTR